jgi:hypothetical protein
VYRRIGGDDGRFGADDARFGADDGRFGGWFGGLDRSAAGCRGVDVPPRRAAMNATRRGSPW